MIKRIPSGASARPSAPPTNDRNTDSVRTCRSTRPELAPSAVRIAISFWRPKALAKIRLATLTHAISSTHATAPSRTSMAGRTSLTRS